MYHILWYAMAAEYKTTPGAPHRAQQTTTDLNTYDREISLGVRISLLVLLKVHRYQCESRHHIPQYHGAQKEQMGEQLKHNCYTKYSKYSSTSLLYVVCR